MPITVEEFAAAVRRQDMLQLQPDGKRAHQLGDQALQATITWTDGEVWTKTTDDEVLATLLRMAELLGARLRGDELETYRGLDDTYVHRDDRADLEASERTVEKILARRRR